MVAWLGSVSLGIHAAPDALGGSSKRAVYYRAEMHKPGDGDGAAKRKATAQPWVQAAGCGTLRHAEAWHHKHSTWGKGAGRSRVSACRASRCRLTSSTPCADSSGADSPSAALASAGLPSSPAALALSGATLAAGGMVDRPAESVWRLAVEACAGCCAGAASSRARGGTACARLSACSAGQSAVSGVVGLSRASKSL